MRFLIRCYSNFHATALDTNSSIVVKQENLGSLFPKQRVFNHSILARSELRHGRALGMVKSAPRQARMSRTTSVWYVCHEQANLTQIMSNDRIRSWQLTTQQALS